MCRIILSSVVCLAVPYFPHYPINGTIFDEYLAQILIKPICAVITLWQINLRYIVSISLLHSNQSIPLQITDKTDRQTSLPSAARSTDCVDIASGSVLPVAQWTWYVRVVCGSGQTGRTSGKCWLVRRFVVCNVYWMLFSLPNQEIWDNYCMWHILWAGEICRGFWWGDLREIFLQECQGIDGGKY